jgi:hypothetical protein
MMKSLLKPLLLAIGVSALSIGTASAFSAPADKALAGSSFVVTVAECMTDDGYGRKRPCSALYKKENPNWRRTSACVTDDGYGRTRPCSALYKKKKGKKARR